MTENKRFIIANYPSDIEDTLTGKKYAMSSYYTHIEIICDLLNELAEENEQLKSFIKGTCIFCGANLRQQYIEKYGDIE